jgi:hypothetical protein
MMVCAGCLTEIDDNCNCGCGCCHRCGTDRFADDIDLTNELLELIEKEKP